MGRVSSAPSSHSPRIGATLRGSDGVTPLELFFDLVFVLALTQTTARMAAHPTWTGVLEALLVLGVMWWAWVGYAWLTSVIDPEEGAVRLVMAASIAGLLVCSLAMPEAFENRALLFAGAYFCVRIAHIVLFRLGSRDDPKLRASVIGLTVSMCIAQTFLVAAAFSDEGLQLIFWALALGIDMSGPYFFGSEGWKIFPKHFAERHGLIIIIALGESIVALGIGAEGIELDFPVVLAAVLGVAVSFAMWWMYFDVVARVAERRLVQAAPGKEQNEIARDSFSYLHFPMVAGIVLVALGLKKTIGHVDHHLELVPASAFLGGFAIYLLAHVAFRWRNVHRFSTQRVVVAGISVALIPLALEINAIYTLVLVALLSSGLVAYETIHFRELRNKMRHELAAH
jgi:low temperature requirement protein LtrA